MAAINSDGSLTLFYSDLKPEAADALLTISGFETEADALQEMRWNEHGLVTYFPPTDEKGYGDAAV